MDNGGEGIDRLSDFPDHILLHILSFLETIHSVQTSVLSTRWISLWKQVTHLNFETDSFQSYPRFRRFLQEAMDAFRGDSRIVKLTYKERNLDDLLGEFDSVMDYAAKFHPHIEHIGVRSGGKLIVWFPGSFLNLVTLELRRVRLYNASAWMRFSILENLALEDCLLYLFYVKYVDIFAKLPCLKNLVLSGCHFVHSRGQCFKISGPQLLNLDIRGLDLRGASVQIVAPKLKCFSFVFDSNVPEFSQLSLPSLDHATIGSQFPLRLVEEEKGMVTAKFVNLFQGLHNATSLRLDYHIIEAMSEICDGLEHQRCPFTRLKCLKVPHSEEPYTIPPQLINYFLKGSSTMNPAAFLQFV